MADFRVAGTSVQTRSSYTKELSNDYFCSAYGRRGRVFVPSGRDLGNSYYTLSKHALTGSELPVVAGSPDPATVATEGLRIHEQPNSCPLLGDLRSSECPGQETGPQPETGAQHDCMNGREIRGFRFKKRLEL